VGGGKVLFTTYWLRYGSPLVSFIYLVLNIKHPFKLQHGNKFLVERRRGSDVEGISSVASF
jgi:hypothetical protein